MRSLWLNGCISSFLDHALVPHRQGETTLSSPVTEDCQPAALREVKQRVLDLDLPLIATHLMCITGNHRLGCGIPLGCLSQEDMGLFR